MRAKCRTYARGSLEPDVTLSAALTKLSDLLVENVSLVPTSGVLSERLGGVIWALSLGLAKYPPLVHMNFN